MKNTTKIVKTVYVNNIITFRKNAYYILKHFYSIPIDENDLILECLQQLLKKSKTFNPTIELTLENYLLSNIKFTMFSYCRSLTRKNSAILNNYLNFDFVENIHSDTYNSMEANFDFLNNIQKEIFKYLYVDNLSIRETAIKTTTTSNFVKKEIKKIQENISKQIDNFIY